MDERMRRQWAASEAGAYGWGGVAAVAHATGLSPTTIRKGQAELALGCAQPGGRKGTGLRRSGAGRNPKTEEDPELVQTLEPLVDRLTRGDPQSPLRWTCKRTRSLARELPAQGHPVSESSVRRLLHVAGYSLQGHRKTREGPAPPDRNAQFAHIKVVVAAFQDRSPPGISVDTKKKDLGGDFKNAGREGQPQGEPEEVRVHDFMAKPLGNAIPYGVYDITETQGWGSVGIDPDTACFAAEALRRWWCNMGSPRYKTARERLIPADGGGSNGSRCRLWKVARYDPATEVEMPTPVCHFPPGTSKGNKIEHRRFSPITPNWRGRPLVSHEVIVNVIANTAPPQGLLIQAELDSGT